MLVLARKIRSNITVTSGSYLLKMTHFFKKKHGVFKPLLIVRMERLTGKIFKARQG